MRHGYDVDRRPAETDRPGWTAKSERAEIGAARRSQCGPRKRRKFTHTARAAKPMDLQKPSSHIHQRILGSHCAAHVVGRQPRFGAANYRKVVCGRLLEGHRHWAKLISGVGLPSATVRFPRRAL